MELMVQQTFAEYAEEQGRLIDAETRVVELEAILMQPVENPFFLRVGKEVAVLRNGATEANTAGKTRTVVEIRSPDGSYSSEKWPVVVLIGGQRYLYALNEVAVIG